MSDSEGGDDGEFVPGGGGGDDGDDDDYGSEKKKKAAKPKAKSKAKAKSSAKGKASSKKKSEGKEGAASGKRKAAGGVAGEEKGTKNAKVEELSGDAAETEVLGYMMKQNRPYSHLQVFENLHQRVKKPTVQRILSEAAAAGRLTAKEWKKNKVYWWNQDNISGSAFTEEQANANAAETKRNLEQVAAIKQYKAQIDHDIKNASSLPSDGECDRLIAQLQVEIKEKTERLKKLSSPAGGGSAPVLVTKDQIKKAQDIFMKPFVLWKRHKMGVESCMQDLWDRKGGTKDGFAEFLETTGIDTDESCNIDFKQYQALASRKL